MLHLTMHGSDFVPLESVYSGYSISPIVAHDFGATIGIVLNHQWRVLIMGAIENMTFEDNWNGNENDRIQLSNLARAMMGDFYE